MKELRIEIRKYIASVLFNWCLDLDPEFFGAIIDLDKLKKQIGK